VCFCYRRSLLEVSGSFHWGLDRCSRSGLMGSPGRLSSAPMSTSSRIAATLPHRTASMSLLPFILGFERGRAPGRRNDTSSLHVAHQIH
jgi:hypothetical protein